MHGSSRWYLLAFDRERGDWRTFRVDRVGARPRTEHSFAPRPLPDDDVARYVARSMATTTRRHQAHATLHAPASEVERRMHWIDGRVEALGDDRASLRIAGDTLAELAVRLVYLDVSFELHEPAELAVYLRSLARRLVRGAAGPRARMPRAEAGRARARPGRRR